LIAEKFGVVLETTLKAFMTIFLLDYHCIWFS